MLKLKKYIIFFLLAPLLILNLSGCTKNTIEPVEKLLEKPITFENHYNVYNEIRKLTPLDTEFVLPLNSEDVGRINRVDLNNDGENEIVTFKKKSNETPGLSNVFMYIFKYKDDRLFEESEKIVKIPGDVIIHANFVDLDNDGKKKIVIQVSSAGLETIYIYEYVNDTVKKIDEYVSKNPVRLNFYDYNKDGKIRCLALVQDSSNYEVKLCELKLINNKINFIESGTSKTSGNIDKIEVTNGKISKNTYGSIMTYHTMDGRVIPQIIVFKDNKFERVIDNGNLKNSNMIVPLDINGNGILEIPKVDNEYLNKESKKSSVISWYEWNGITGEDSALILTNQIFYCSNYNFKLKVPKRLTSKFYIKQNFTEENSDFTFFSRENEKLEKLFKIKVIKKFSDDKNKGISNTDKIYENNEYIFALESLNKKNMNKYNLSFMSVKDSFELINK
ncbi:FG-GAP repeat domain-containing protein [Peptostreptococcus faecalis]|uniref:FG-GAP repeat domain-containing protein n=1 Tax=Peptostreptococcus faecalis TaxID=2045015 RepID=UPI000C7AC90F|nr:VCBS repeat-containing protein [Peptostreptococcus faecalis]